MQMAANDSAETGLGRFTASLPSGAISDRTGKHQTSSRATRSMRVIFWAYSLPTQLPTISVDAASRLIKASVLLFLL